jgi:ribose-phosphate pyrophosphokinase
VGFLSNFMEEVAIIADSKGEGVEFAKGVYSYLKTKEGKDFSVSWVNLEKTVFRDKEFKMKIADNIRGKNCFFIHDSNKNPTDWFTELIFTLEATTFSSPKEVNVVLPYTRFARQDRKEESRVSVNAKALADTMSLYATRGMTVDLHTPQMQEYFRIPYDNLFSVTSLINYLKKNHFEILNNLVLVSSDLGGAKNVEYLVKIFKKMGFDAGIALGHKTREKANEVAKSVIIGEVEGKNCLIVDDIIDTGNTMVLTAQKLKEKGANKIYAYATHGLFSEGIEKFKVFDKVIVSDTLKTPPAENKEIMSLVHLFGEAIYRTSIGKSLSVLFDEPKTNQDSLEKYDI